MKDLKYFNSHFHFLDNITLHNVPQGDGWISREAAGLAFDFVPSDPCTYVTGTYTTVLASNVFFGHFANVFFITILPPDEISAHLLASSIRHLRLHLPAPLCQHFPLSVPSPLSPPTSSSSSTYLSLPLPSSPYFLPSLPLLTSSLFLTCRH